MIALLDRLTGRLLALFDRPAAALVGWLIRLAPVDPDGEDEERLDDIIRRTKP